MLRLLGILSLGHLLFGGRHHRLRRGILFGALLGYLANRRFDTDRVSEDIRKAAKEARKTARSAVKAARRELEKAGLGQKADEIRETINARKAARGERARTAGADAGERNAARTAAAQAETIRALPTSGTREAEAIRELTEDLERDARTAAMAANVPTIEFPEEDGKYFSSGKYGYVR